MSRNCAKRSKRIGERQTRPRECGRNMQHKRELTEMQKHTPFVPVQPPSKQTTLIQLRLGDIHSKVKRAAALNELSMQAFCVQAIKYALEHMQIDD